MAYTPTNNPYIPGDPYSYDLKWIVAQLKYIISAYAPLSAEFNDLKNYVDNYFANLDISEEINDKIDAMEADGTLDEIILRALEEYLNGIYITPQMFGAIADGIADDTSAVQQAVNYRALAGGGPVYIPAGKYKIQNVTIPAGVTMTGEQQPATADLSRGSVFYCIDPDNSALTLTGDNEVGNISIYYPNAALLNDIPNIQYPATILIPDGCANVYIHDMTLYNSYQGIKLEYQNGPVTVERINGYCIYNFIDIDGNYDVIRVNDCHLIYTYLNGLLNSADAVKYGQWTRNNGRALMVGDSAWPIITNIFAFAYYIGIDFYESTTGPYNGYNGKYTNCGFDSCGIGINGLAGVNNSFIGCTFSTGPGGAQLTSSILPDYGIIAGGMNNMLIDSCIFTGFHKGVFNISDGNVSINNCFVNVWNIDAGNDPTYLILADDATINFTNNVIVSNGTADSLGISTGADLDLLHIANNIFKSFVVPVLANPAAGVLANNNFYSNTAIDYQIGDTTIPAYTAPALLTTSDSVTIPATILNTSDLITITLRRQGYVGNVIIPTSLILSSACVNGIRINDGSASNTYWRITIDAAGIIRLQVDTTASIEPFVEIAGLFAH